MFALSVLFGGVVGLSLGLTGGGGSIFAVPLLVYGLAVRPSEAVSVSLAAVGATALLGAVTRLRRREIDVRTGLIFAAAGMIGAPAGAWLAAFVDDTTLLVLFAGLMLVVAARMWQGAGRARTTPADTSADATPNRPIQQWAWLTGIGVVTGVLSGLFGVGGGFVIVPGLVLFTGMSVHRAVATSLMVIAMVSAAGLASHVVAGQSVALGVTGLFVLGGVLGVELGSRMGRRLSGAGLQKVFAAAMIAVAGFIVIRNVA